MQEKERQEPFYKVYRKDCGRGLNPKELLIISLVKSYEDDNKKFFMSNEYISKEIGLTKRAVQNNINKLVGKGELFKKEVRDNSRGQANCIRILSTKPLEPSAETAYGNTEPSADFAQKRMQILQEPSAETAYGNTEPSAETAYGNTEPSADFAQKRMQILQEPSAETAPYNNSYNKNYYKKSENPKNRSTDLNNLTPIEKEESFKNESLSSEPIILSEEQKKTLEELERMIRGY